ncbi:MAG: hypothetical protein K8R77_03615, partial [Anaerolineaceae bacterium]|nr:hypothetical protein [Anaerolineaceae bacterium]
MTKNTTPPEQQPEAEVRFSPRLRRLLLDILGVLILVGGLLTALGLLGLTSGGVITPWAERLQRFFGWGSFLGVVFILAVGSIFLLSRFTDFSGLKLGRVLLIELVAVLFLAFLDAFGGHVLVAAEAGENGGLFGWVLNKFVRQLFPGPWDMVILGLLLVTLIFFGSGLNRLAERRIERWLFAQPERFSLPEAEQELV